MRPAFLILADSVNITALVADRLVDLVITDKAGVKSDRLELVIDDRDERLELPETGAKLEVSIGYRGGSLARMGSYVVDGIEVGGACTSASSPTTPPARRKWSPTTSPPCRSSARSACSSSRA